MAILSPLSWPILALAAWTLYCQACLLRNYLVARRIGVPVRIIPIDHLNPLWALIDHRVVSLIRRLPGPLGNNSFTRYNFRCFEMADEVRLRSHDELGAAFVLCTPSRNWFYVGSASLAEEMYRRRADFPKCVQLTEVLDVFGRSVGTAEGAKWKAQRKMIASCFNEPFYADVWREAIGLSRDMVRYWAAAGGADAGVRSSADDLRTLSLHILSGAGFGKYQPFEGHEEKVAANAGVSGGYKDDLQMILENCVLMVALGPKFLSRLGPQLPGTWKLARLSEACARFQQYMAQEYEEAKAKVARSGAGADTKTLMSSLVRASQDEAKAGAIGLTEKDIYANIFVLNFAGHDTTAHTLTFAIHFLAANPDVQTWAAEEARAVLSSNDPDDWTYAASFARLKRTLAIMNETLRLYTIVPQGKWTRDRTVTLEIEGKEVVLPPRTMVIPAYATLHSRAEYWGADPLAWRPSRWIGEGGGGPGREELVTPRRTTFVGWGEGWRDCPGKKFSQVEFVAAIALLMRDWQLDPVPENGESLEGARRRVENLIKNDSGPVLLLQMLHPERAALRWTRRG